MNTLANIQELARALRNMIRTGIIIETDLHAGSCRVQTGGMCTDWLQWLTHRAGRSRTWWAPSVGEQVLILAVGGELDTAFVLPGIYSSDNPAPSASEDALHIRFPDGAVIEYEPETSALTASGIKTASVMASDSVTATVPVVTVKASTRVTLDTPEVVCTNKLTTGTLEVQKGGTMRGNIAHNDLDVIGANYNTTRLTITPADDSTIPPTPAVMESDTDYRLRIQQAFEGLSVAGSVGAYQYHGRSADGRVADISVTSPSPACVTISVLSRENNGVASEDLLAVVRNALNGEDVRPVADRVTVQSAAIVEYQINATLYLYPGPESEPIRAAAVKKLEAYITAQHRLGRDIRLSAIYAALHVEGVQRVELAAPLADIVLNNTQASFCTEYSVVTGGSDE